MLGKILNILGTIVIVFLIGWALFSLGYLGYAAVEFGLEHTVVLWVVGSIIVLLIVANAVASFNSKKLEADRRKYYDAPELCPHRKVQLTQQDFGVITFTTKWCAVCGKNLGPA